MSRHQYSPNIGPVNLGSATSVRSWLDYDGTADGSGNVIESNALSTTSTTPPGACPLDSSRVAFAYVMADDTLHLAIAKNDGTSGTIAVEATGFSKSGRVIVRKVTTDKVAVGFVDGTNFHVIKTYTISGVTPTLDASVTVVAATANYLAFAFDFLSATVGLVTFYDGANYVVDRLDVGSGSIALHGSTATLTGGTSVSSWNMRALTSTTALLLWSDSNSRNTVRVITTGAPPTLGTTQQVFSFSTGAPPTITQLRTNAAFDRAVVINSRPDATNPTLASVGVSGTTVTPPTLTNEQKGSSPYLSGGLAYMDTDTAGTDFYLAAFTMTRADTPALGVIAAPSGSQVFNFGKTIGMGTASATSLYASIAMLSTVQAIAFYPNASDYPTFKVVNLS